ENALFLRDSLVKLGSAIAARIPITAMVTSISSSVKPDSRSRMGALYRKRWLRRKRKPPERVRRSVVEVRSVCVDRGRGERGGRVAVGRGAGQRVHDLGAVAVEVAGRLGGERRRRAGVVVVEQAGLVDLEVELLPDRVGREAGRDRRAVVVG